MNTSSQKTATIMSNVANEIINKRLNESQTKAPPINVSLTGSRSDVKRKQLREAAVAKQKLLTNNLLSMVEHVVTESLWFDKDFLAEEVLEISSSIREMTETLLVSGYFTETSYHDNPSADVRNIFNFLNESDEQVNDFSPVEDSVKAVSAKVLGKVKQTLKVEKDIAADNKARLDGVKESAIRNAATNVKTLYRSLTHFNASSLSESVENRSDVVTANTLLQYTVLETLNTMNLIDMNEQMLRSMCTSITK